MSEAKDAHVRATRDELAAARSLRDLWNVYLRRVIPPNASPAQVTETRRAFYSGADAIFKLMLFLMDATSDEPTASDMRLMQTISGELDTFAAQVQKGAA